MRSADVDDENFHEWFDGVVVGDWCRSVHLHAADRGRKRRRPRFGNGDLCVPRKHRSSCAIRKTGSITAFGRHSALAMPDSLTPALTESNLVRSYVEPLLTGDVGS